MMILVYQFDFQSIYSKALLAGSVRPNPSQQGAFQSRQSAPARPAPTPQTALAQRTCKQARRAGIEPTRGLAQRTCKQARRAGIEPTRGDPIGLAGRRPIGERESNPRGETPSA